MRGRIKHWTRGFSPFTYTVVDSSGAAATATATVTVSKQTAGAWRGCSVGFKHEVLSEVYQRPGAGPQTRAGQLT